jgi:hypothetical protein
LAAALHHARHGNLQCDAMLAGYARAALAGKRPLSVCLRLQQSVRDRVAAFASSTTVDGWLAAGERLNEQQAAAIAFDDASLDGLQS